MWTLVRTRGSSGGSCAFGGQPELQLKHIIMNMYKVPTVSKGSARVVPEGQSLTVMPKVDGRPESGRGSPKRSRPSSRAEDSKDSKAGLGPTRQGQGGDGKEARKDRFGTRIDKDKKKHRISFRDNVNAGRLADVHEVESYRQYNVLVDTTTTGCTCHLL